MVVYVTEETYAHLQEIAKEENRSISNVAERKIIVGLRAGPDRTEPDLTETARIRIAHTGLDSNDLKTSVIDVLDNLPSESLTHLADKLARILDTPLPIRTGQDQTVPDHDKTPIPITNVMNLQLDYAKEKQKKVLEVATRLSEFVQKKKISQKSFRKIYGVNITNHKFWLAGTRGMSLEMIEKLEKIISSDSAKE